MKTLSTPFNPEGFDKLHLPNVLQDSLQAALISMHVTDDLSQLSEASKPVTQIIRTLDTTGYADSAANLMFAERPERLPDSLGFRLCSLSMVSVVGARAELFSKYNPIQVNDLLTIVNDGYPEMGTIQHLLSPQTAQAGKRIVELVCTSENFVDRLSGWKNNRSRELGALSQELVDHCFTPMLTFFDEAITKGTS